MPPHPGMYSSPRYFWRENKTTTFPPHCGDIGEGKNTAHSPAITGNSPGPGGGRGCNWLVHYYLADSEMNEHRLHVQMDHKLALHFDKLSHMTLFIPHMKKILWKQDFLNFKVCSDQASLLCRSIDIVCLCFRISLRSNKKML